MTGNKFLLDTNIITALIKGDSGIAQKIEAASSIYIPIIALGELYHGALNSTFGKRNIFPLKKLTSRYKLLLLDEKTAIEYGGLRTKLRAQGTPIPDNDIWIAAIALRYNLIVVTRDGHFNFIKGLNIANW